MLECKDVVKKYISVTAVDGVTVNVGDGRVVALLGPNGSGKTTLMKMIAGLSKPTSGTITYNGSIIGPETKKHIAYMPTEGFYYSYMNVKDVGKYYADFFEDFSTEKYYEMIENMELDAKMKASKMSSGMMAKLKLCATLSRNSDFIMLDEPLNGIDIIAREKIVNAIKANATESKTIVLSSHLVDELEKIIDDAIFLKHGKLVNAGSIDELKANSGKSIVDLYKEYYA